MSRVANLIVPKETANDETLKVVALHVENGTIVSKGTAILELETSKANLTLESEISGQVELLSKVDDIVSVGATVARIHASDLNRITPSGPAPRSPRQERETSSNHAEPFFSDAALKLIETEKLDRNLFQKSGYITSNDVRQMNSEELNHSQAPVGQELPSETPSSNQIPEPEYYSWLHLKFCLAADLCRLGADCNRRSFLKAFSSNPAFRAIVYYRIRIFCFHRAWLRKTIARGFAFLGNRHAIRFGIRLPVSARIGPGLYIPHWGGIWLNPSTVIGANCNLSQEISIGSAGPAAQSGHPKIGDRVFIGPGARISGDITIGNDVLIGANSLVISDIAADRAVIGVPASVVSHSGSRGFINNPCDSESQPQ